MRLTQHEATFKRTLISAIVGGIGVDAALSMGLGCVEVDLAAIEAIDERRTQDLKLSREHLAARSISQTPNPHGG